jgi:2-hydroxy-3-oxopropionate reductase
MNIGFIGLGGMGRPMAEHLLGAGHRLTVWARRREAAEPVLALGASWVDSPAALARQSEIVCPNVTGSADVVGLAERNLDDFAPGSIHVDFSTIAPSVARDLALRYADRGVHFVDAPVSGGTAGARAGTLSIMWGGNSALTGRLDALFACLGKTIVHVGPAGAGQVAKVCNQLVMVAAIEACAEAARLAAVSGVDFGQVRAAMLGGSAGSRVLEFFGEKMLRRDFAAGVEARLHHKDFVAALGEAAAQNIPLPVAGTVLQALDALMAAGWGGEDTSRLLCVLERASGYSQRKENA